MQPQSALGATLGRIEKAMSLKNHSGFLQGDWPSLSSYGTLDEDIRRHEFPPREASLSIYGVNCREKG